MKKLNLFLVISVALSLIVCLSGCGGTPITPPIEEDFINIISVTPDSGLVDGVDTDFKVIVEYNLVSSNLGCYKLVLIMFVILQGAILKPMKCV